MKSTFLTFLLLIGTALTAKSDQIFLIGQTKEGVFQGFEKGKFEFAPLKGRFITTQATGVSKLVITNAVKVSYQTVDGKEEESGLLKGYDKSKFTIVKDGKDISIALLKMKKIELAPEEGAATDGKERADAYPVPAVNLADFGADLTPDQQTALEQFKNAKKAFDAFVQESSTLVAQMDKATGPKREDYLNKLRSRKNDEQPLRKNLRSAYKTLVRAFPEQPDTGAKPAAPAAAGKTQAPAAVQETPAAETKAAEAKQPEPAKAPAAVSTETAPPPPPNPEMKTIKINVDNSQPDKLVL